MLAEFVDKLDAFKQISQLRLTKILDNAGGSKDLVVDSSLMKPLERILGIKLLRSHGVDKLFKLDKKEVASSNNNLVYLVRGDLITVKRVCDQINASSVLDRQYHLIAFPKVFHSIEVLIEEEGLYEKLKLHSFHWELISLDQRIFSMECLEAFKCLFVSKDETYIGSLTQSLWSLQHIFGKAPFKIFLGSFSKAIGALLEVMNEGIGESDSPDTDLGLLLVVDRDIDYVSPLLTPHTYTALVSDIVGTNCNVVDINLEDGKSPRTVILSSEDNTYNQIKHKLFSEKLDDIKKKINDSYVDTCKRKNMTVQQMRDFVQNDLSNTAKSGQILSNHLHISEQIMKKVGNLFEGLQICQHDILTHNSSKECVTFIEDLIASGANLNIVLRLLCLFSLCQNGLPLNKASSLKMQLFHSYGHQHILTFHNLEKMGLFTISGSEYTANLANKVKQVVTLPRKSGFQTTAGKLGLFPDANEKQTSSNTQDLSYVFGGLYIPLIVQLVKIILTKEKTLKDLIKCFLSEGVEMEVQGRSLETSPDINPRTIWVYVVGGITYSEIAAFALLEKITGCRIVSSGSSIINGNNIVQSAL